MNEVLFGVSQTLERAKRKDQTTITISINQADFLLEQVEKAEIYKKALIDLHLEGLTLDEILAEADRWGKKK